MKKITAIFQDKVEGFLNRFGLGMRAKLIIIFLVAKVLPLILLTIIAWQQITVLGQTLRDIAVSDSSQALNDSAVENIERMTTDTAKQVADFLYGRDDDILYLASLEPTEENYRQFIEGAVGKVMQKGTWELAEDGQSWVRIDPAVHVATTGGVSTNQENDDMDGFHYRQPDEFAYNLVPLYDEITYVDLEGNELIKVVAENSTKINHQLSTEKRNIANRENTFVKAETYYDKLDSLGIGDIYVSDVIGAYVGSNYIGMYTPEIVAAAAETRGYDIAYEPETQAYSGMENPNGERFEGIVRWATPVTDDTGAITGYVTFALNHDHIMEFVDHITPMNERYTELPSAYEGNYAFIWDYQCRSICHPRHHSIVGYDPETGDPQIPWLESSIYEAWQESGVEKWMDFVEGLPTFNNQSRSKAPASILTRMGLVGLDGRYLDNAPQCTGWMDLTQDGGSGSFYILWSGLYKLTTAGAIPYYTGQYAPSEENGYSRRGFGFVAIGAGLEDFTRPARETEARLDSAIEDNLGETFTKLAIAAIIMITFVVFIAIVLASSITDRITNLIEGISRFRAGERQFRFNAPVKDEFGTLADSFDEMADSIVDSVQTPLCITDMDQKIIYMNEQGLTLRGMTLEEAIGKPYSENSVYPPGTRYCPITALEEGFETETYYAQGLDKYVRGSASYLLSKEGERIGYIVLTNDVSEMVRVQLKTEEQRTLLDRIFSASPDLIWYQDMKGEYLAVNPRYSAIAGLSPDDVIGKTAKDIMPDGFAEYSARNDKEAFEYGKPLYSEESVTFADGHVETLDAVRTPIFDTNGKPVALLGYARDVSARVEIESELRQTQLDLEQAVNDANRANEHKGEFLARMSHEIRTPMNAIIGLTNIVQRKLNDIPYQDDNTREVGGHIQQIEVSSQHLLGLLNDILDISKIEAGKIELAQETMDLPKLANTVAGIIKPRCDEKNIRFITSFDDFDPANFVGDSLRLRQVLINLLGNAVKFTPELGAIEFSIRCKERANGKTHVAFGVRDTGIGIAPERLDAIFQPFEQAEAGTSRKYGGTGLGLAISQRIVELFGGEIHVDSEMGEGSLFSFSLWLTETEAEPDAPDLLADAAGKFAGKRALLVDDVDINRMIVTALLEVTGMEIDEAEDGVVAVDKFAASDAGYYDIVFMDIQMPNMDGYEATEAIRALDRGDAGTVPIVALTANAFKEDSDHAIAHGMNAHITKPVDMEKLLEVLYKYLPGMRK